MSKFVLLDTRIFAGGADLTSHGNKVELSAELEVKPTTNFGSAKWKEVLAGLASTAISAEGQWEAGDSGKVDDSTWSGLGGLGPWTICPESASVGELAWLTNAMRGNYSLGGTVGDVAPWSASAVGSWPLCRGVMLHPPGTARTTTGDGTAVQHVAVPAGKNVYAALHVLSVSGTSNPTITVAVESDVDALFNGSETTRITFAAATARGGQILRAAGPVTDTFWRATWTVSGATPSFLFAVSLGIA